LAGVDDVDAAVRAADEAFGEWRAWRPADRARVLRRFAELLVRDTDELGRLSVLDIGMPYSSRGGVVSIAVNWAAYYAGWADKIEGRVTSVPAQQRELAFTIREPYGVIGIILTWNGPMSSIGMKLMPDLAAGNTVVLKPSELTPYAVEHVMQLVGEAGPVLSLMRFSSEEEAIEMANATPYGLSSYVYNSDLGRAGRLVRRLHAGGVYINGAGPVAGCELPFGGVGISGFGREGGEEGLLEFLRTKAVGIA